MARLYRVKDGPRGGRTDQGVEMTVGALLLKLPNYKCQYLGEQEPEFHPDNPGCYYSHMVISIREVAETGMAFPKTGFYRIVNLDPGKALFLYQTEEAASCKNGCSQ